MAADPVLVLGWLVVAHLVADFVLQTDAMVADKTATGRRRRWRGLLVHGLLVGACLVPFIWAFGQPGLWVALTVTISHVLIDRWKVGATRRAEARALADAHRRLPGGAREAAPDVEAGEGPGLGPAWTPIPAGLFVADQVAHLAVITTAWAVWLAGAAPLDWFAAGVERVFRGWDLAVVHEAALVGVVGIALVIVNVRAGALLVATLVRPREATEGLEIPDEPHSREPLPPGWRIRVGRIEAVAVPEHPDGGSDAAGTGRDRGTATRDRASPARIGATIGVLERLLIVVLVLTGSEAAIGFVVAAKTLARFRQLDDRDFAEYYLLGTLASVAIAIASALVAAAALRTLA